jgi:hypothetical protein
MPPRHHTPTTSLSSLETSPEMLLVTAVIRQALLDVDSGSDAIRQDALRFWQNLAEVATWSDLLDCDAQHLAQAVLQRGREA